MEPTTDPSRGRRTATLLAKGAQVVAVSFVLGGLTSPAQLWLPDALRPFANSSSGWTLLTALVVWGVRERTIPSAVFGALSFVSLVAGYETVSALRGFPDTEVVFLVAAVVVGPFVGVAAHWIGGRTRRAALATGVLAGIGVGDGVSGLVRVAGSTGWVYWTLIGAVGLLLAVLMIAVRLRTARDRLLAAASTAVIAALLVAALGLI